MDSGAGVVGVAGAVGAVDSGAGAAGIVGAAGAVVLGAGAAGVFASGAGAAGWLVVGWPAGSMGAFDLPGTKMK